MLSFCLSLKIILLIKILLQKQKVNIIFASSPQLPAAFLSLILAKFIRVPFIFEVRDLWPQVLIDQPGKKNKFLIFFLKIYRKINLQIFNSYCCII